MEARGPKRARSSSDDDSDIESRAFESDVSQDREGQRRPLTASGAAAHVHF